MKSKKYPDGNCLTHIILNSLLFEHKVKIIKIQYLETTLLYTYDNTRKQYSQR